MGTLPNKKEMLALIQREYVALSATEQAFLQARLIPLQKKSLTWEYGRNESYESWVFADFRERNVGAAYCQGGFGALGAPWGLIFFHNDSFGMDCGWYRSLADLLHDGWIA